MFTVNEVLYRQNQNHVQNSKNPVTGANNLMNEVFTSVDKQRASRVQINEKSTNAYM